MPRHNFAAPRGTTVEFTIESEAVRNNRLGDPTSRRVAVYLPEGYADSTEDYPVLVDLVGFTGSGLAHLSWKVFGESVPQRLDRLVAQGAMGPVIAVFPDCFTSLGGNQYINSSTMGNWEDFLVDELLPAIEDRFRARPGREHRGVFGKSSGGYGSIAHGLRRADAWGAVACHSGDMGFARCYSDSLSSILDRLAAHERSIEQLLGALEAQPKMVDADLHAVEILAMAASYDPDPESGLGIRLPVDLFTGELIPERWANWMAHDPVEMVKVPEYQANLRTLRGLYIDCGSQDQYKLVYGARSLVAQLAAADIQHTYEEFDDDHSNIDYRMDISLPFLYEALTTG